MPGRFVLACAGRGAALLVFALAAGAGLIPLSFAAFVSVPLGPPACTDTVDCSEGAIAATAGDFNHDGKLDIATANNGSDDVTILLGDGKGGLTWSFTAASKDAPSAIAAGNLNDDTMLDLVVAKEYANQIGVLLGKGNGTFDPEVVYDMGNSPESVVLADFNGDTKLDVATADQFSDTVSVRLGNGDGTFGDLIQTPVPGGPVGMAAGKIDGDGILDLAVSLNLDSQLAILIGKGDGKFLYAGTSAAITLDDSPVGVALADFNNDHKLDVAVATESFDIVDVLLGNGDGTFQAVTQYGVGGFPESVVAGDFNGDGIVDLASADSLGTINSDGDVSVLLGKGDGTFDDSQQFAVDAGPFGLIAPDLNNDRLPDLVSANLDGTTVSVLVNTGTPPAPACVGDCDGSHMVGIGELVTGVNISLGTAELSTCTAFDANGDGKVGINELVTAVNNALSSCPVA